MCQGLKERSSVIPDPSIFFILKPWMSYGSGEYDMKKWVAPAEKDVEKYICKTISAVHKFH